MIPYLNFTKFIKILQIGDLEIKGFSNWTSCNLDEFIRHSFSGNTRNMKYGTHIFGITRHLELPGVLTWIMTYHQGLRAEDP